jgi:DNA-directed RNA polymerase subunit P
MRKRRGNMALLDKDLDSMKGILYECNRCGKRFDGREIAERGNLKCPHCGYKIIKKVKPPVVKRIKAI